MILNKSKFFFAPAVILFAALFEVVPAAAGCGFYGCGGGAVVIVQPQPYVYQSCSCCGCGASSYYGAYAPVYGYQPSYSYGEYSGAYYRPRYCGGYGGYGGYGGDGYGGGVWPYGGC